MGGVMQESFSSGDIVATLELGNLYQVIEVDQQGRIICDPITQRQWKEPFVFPAEALKKELPILCPQCTPWSDLILDVITGHRWACAHKFVELGYKLYVSLDSCPACLLGRPHHLEGCNLIRVSNNICLINTGKEVCA